MNYQTIHRTTNTGLEKMICQSLSAEDQAARILGVTISHVSRPLRATYGTYRSALEVFKTLEGGYLIVSSNVSCFDAAHVADIQVGISHGYDEVSENREIFAEVGVIAPGDLFEEYQRQEDSGALSVDRSRAFVENDPTDIMNMGQLIEKIQDARSIWEESLEDSEAETTGLSVNRHVNADGYYWDVSFYEDHEKTIILNEGAELQTNDELARIVVGCWDPDWDSV